MPNEMEEAYAWLEQEQDRPEVDYLKHLIKTHQQLLRRQMETTDTARRDRDALRESSRQLAQLQMQFQESQEDMKVRVKEIFDLKSDHKALKEKYDHSFKALEEVEDFVRKMQSYLGSSS